MSSTLFQSFGYLGQGTTAPKDAFHVAFTDPGGAITGYAVQNLSGAANAYSGMLFYDQNGAVANFQGFGNSTHEYRINNVASGGILNFLIGSDSKLKVANTGDVGVGVASPAFKLDVAGDVNMAGALKQGGLTILQVPPATATSRWGLARSPTTAASATATLRWEPTRS